MNETSPDPGQGREVHDPDYGERPESPDPGHPVGETSPAAEPDEVTHEHPEDVAPPGGSERDDAPTTSPGTPPDPEGG